MLMGIVFAHVWGVLQLILAASFVRTTRIRTIAWGIAVGLYVCAPLAILIQAVWLRTFSSFSGVAVSDLIGIASFSIDPCLEEGIKLLPLAALVSLPVVRRQWRVTDCVLLGAALGSGFGLAENLYRHGDAVQQAVAVNDGWVFGNALRPFMVPGFLETLTMWLPTGVFVGEGMLGPRGFTVNLHLIWSALGGLAVGLWTVDGGSRARLAAVLILLFVSADHAIFNLRVSSTSSSVALLTSPFGFMRYVDWAFPILALGVAWSLDRRYQRTPAAELQLSFERAESRPLRGIVRAAVQQLPWSVAWVDAFVRLRRRRNASVALGNIDRQPLDALTLATRDRVEQLLAHNPPSLTSVIRQIPWRAYVSRPAAIFWLVLSAPAVLWFVIGGFPATSGLQSVLVLPGVWMAVLGISIAGQGWLLWHALRAWPRLRLLSRAPMADHAVELSLQACAACGAAIFGLYGVTRALIGGTPDAPLLINAHASSAAAESDAFGPALLSGAGVVAMPWSGIGLAGGTAVGAAAAGGTEAAAAGGVARVFGAGPQAVGGAVVTAAAIGATFGIPKAVAHAEDLADQSDPDERSLPGGVLPSGTIPEPTAPTIPAPSPTAPTWPAPPANPAPDIPAGEPSPYPGSDPLNPRIPGPPRNPSGVPQYESTTPNAPDTPDRRFPPDWQHGAPTKPTPDDPHVAPDPNQPPPPPPPHPYR
jgi:hypothetical protein